MDVIIEDHLQTISSKLATTPFHQVFCVEYADQHYFQLAYLQNICGIFFLLWYQRYSAITWFEELLLFNIVGSKQTNSHVRFEFRASKLSVLVAFHQQIESWLKSWLLDLSWHIETQSSPHNVC